MTRDEKIALKRKRQEEKLARKEERKRLKEEKRWARKNKGQPVQAFQPEKVEQAKNEPVLEQAPIKLEQAPIKEEQVEKDEPKQEVVLPNKKDDKLENDGIERQNDGIERQKVYHISLRESDGKWQVKFEKGKRPLKLFDTQEEAINFAKEKAENQDGRIVIHKMDGKIRKQNYAKKNK